jgi:hypothetical protein
LPVGVDAGGDIVAPMSFIAATDREMRPVS